MDDAKYLEQKRAQIDNLRQLQQLLTVAQENFDNCSEERKQAWNSYGEDDFERAQKHLQKANGYLKLSRQNIDVIQKTDKLTKAAEELQMKAHKLGDDINREQEDIDSLAFNCQWLIELDIAIKDADVEQNWVLCRRYLMDALAVKPDSPKFIAYLEKINKLYENANSSKSRSTFKRYAK